MGPVMPQVCEQTGSSYLMGGPLWSEQLHDPAWVSAVTRIVQVPPRLQQFWWQQPLAAHLNQPVLLCCRLAKPYVSMQATYSSG